ncbi:MAG: FecR domain-containing protein [Caenibius sp.]
MSGEEDRIASEAAIWHAASANDDMDWDGFTTWLEADPRHAVIYDEIALADARLQELTPTLTPPLMAANDAAEAEHATYQGRHAGWWRWAGGALAACLVAVLAVPQFLQTDPHIYETADASRTIALADGSHIALAPHSRLQIADGEQDMELSGGAWFNISHDPSRKLTITAGQLQISDIGTQFDVQHNGDGVRVNVAEGTVNVSSQALSAPVRLEAGRGLLFDASNGVSRVNAIPLEDAGSWRSGRLSYQSMPLALVASDITRYAGVQVTVAETLRNREFSGTLIVTDGKTALRDLSQLMGVDVTGNGDSFRLVPPDR